MAHFYGRVNSWDVVNEALAADFSGNMEDNVFLRKLGPGYVDDCFRVAHQVFVLSFFLAVSTCPPLRACSRMLGWKVTELVSRHAFCFISPTVF